MKQLYFTTEEFKARLEKTRQSMAEKNLDLLIVSDPSNMNWLTGYDGWSFYVHQGLIVPMEGDIYWFGRLQDRNGALLRCYMNDTCLIGYPEDHIQNPEKHPMTWIANNVIIPNGWQNKRIGVEMDNYYYSALAHAELVKALPNASFENATALVNWQRAVKSAAEIEYMRIAGKIIGKTFEKVFETAEEGLPKNLLVAEIYKSLTEGVEGFGGDYPAIVPLLPSGIEASASHLTWDDRPLKSGESTFFELSGCYRRYHCPTSRTIFIGKPTQEILNAEEALIVALDKGLAQAKPGNRTCDIANALDKVMQDYGIDRHGARCGYPIGVSYPPDWGERTMSLRSMDQTILEPGMTFHFMPGIWQKDWGIEITESILITETGVETLSNIPRKLYVK